MGNTLAPGHFFGRRNIDHIGPGFTVALREATVPPEALPEHSHEGAHFVLAIDAGYISAAINNRERNGPMTLVYNPPGTLHRDRFTGNDGRFLSIDIEPDMTPSEIIDPFIVNQMSARFLAGRIAGEITAHSADPVVLEDMLLAAIAEIGPAKPGSGTSPRWLETAREAMADMAGDSALQIRDIAAAVGVHPVHFARVHRSHLGCSPGTALRRHRIAQALSNLPCGTDLAQVALEAGFADQSHMTRAFRRDLGTTPARFRDVFA